MAEKKMIRKVISKVSSVKKEYVKKAEEVVEQTEDSQKEGSVRTDTSRLKKVCPFCQSKTNPSYTDTVALRRFTTDRVKITPRAKTGLCSKHQRIVTKQIKYARHLALLPFVPKV